MPPSSREKILNPQIQDENLCLLWNDPRVKYVGFDSNDFRANWEIWMQLTNYVIFFSLPMIIDVFVKENNNNDNLSRWQLSTSPDKTRRVHVQGPIWIMGISTDKQGYRSCSTKQTVVTFDSLFVCLLELKLSMN